MNVPRAMVARAQTRPLRPPAPVDSRHPDAGKPVATMTANGTTRRAHGLKVAGRRSNVGRMATSGLPFAIAFWVTAF